MVSIIGGIGFIGLIIFFVMAVKARKNKTGKANKMWIFTAICAAVFLACFALSGGNAQTSNASSSKIKSVSAKPLVKAQQKLTPDQKVDQDLENIAAENVLNLKNPKFSHLTFKNDTDNGTYTVGGVVEGIDQTGKKVEYDFSTYTDGSNTVQWSTENTSTYKVETGTIDTSTGVVKTLK